VIEFGYGDPTVLLCLIDTGKFVPCECIMTGMAFGAGVFLDGMGCYRNIGLLLLATSVLDLIERYCFKPLLQALFISCWHSSAISCIRAEAHSHSA
jgi:hypothetical protein